jgi:hypothetical protein
VNATCTGCQRRLCAERAATVPDGAARHKARGLCVSCYRRQFAKDKNVTDKFAACDQCGYVRRVRRVGTGLCKRCYDQRRWDHPATDAELADMALAGGRWVPNGRGIVVWQEDISA